MKFFKDKTVGFYTALVLIVLSAVITIVYAVEYHASVYMSWFVFTVFLLGTAVGIVLLFLGKLKYYPTVAFLASLIGIGVFLLSTFNYIVDAYVGIDVASLSAGFVGCVTMMAIQFVLAFVSNLFPAEADR